MPWPDGCTVLSFTLKTCAQPCYWSFLDSLTWRLFFIIRPCFFCLLCKTHTHDQLEGSIDGSRYIAFLPGVDPPNLHSRHRLLNSADHRPSGQDLQKTRALDPDHCRIRNYQDTAAMSPRGNHSRPKFEVPTHHHPVKSHITAICFEFPHLLRLPPVRPVRRFSQFGIPDPTFTATATLLLAANATGSMTAFIWALLAATLHQQAPRRPFHPSAEGRPHFGDWRKKAARQPPWPIGRLGRFFTAAVTPLARRINIASASPASCITFTHGLSQSWCRSTSPCYQFSAPTSRHCRHYLQPVERYACWHCLPPSLARENCCKAVHFYSSTKDRQLITAAIKQPSDS